MTVVRCIGFASFVLVVGCGGDTAKSRNMATTAKPPVPALSPEDVAAHNRAVAHMNRNEIAAAETILKELADKHPDNETIVVDRAIAAMHRIIGGANAVPLFESALQRFPQSDRARY